jgi:hypothetical protein
MKPGILTGPIFVSISPRGREIEKTRNPLFSLATCEIEFPKIASPSDWRTYKVEGMPGEEKTVTVDPLICISSIPLRGTSKIVSSAKAEGEKVTMKRSVTIIRGI